MQVWLYTKDVGKSAWLAVNEKVLPDNIRFYGVEKHINFPSSHSIKRNREENPKEQTLETGHYLSPRRGRIWG